MARKTRTARGAIPVAVESIKGALKDAPEGSTVQVIVRPPRLTAAEKREKILEMLDQGYTYIQIQDALQVSPSTISAVRARGATAPRNPSPSDLPVPAGKPAKASPAAVDPMAALELEEINAALARLEARKRVLMLIGGPVQ